MRTFWLLLVLTISLQRPIYAQESDLFTDTLAVEAEITLPDSETGGRLMAPVEMESTKGYQSEEIYLRDFNEGKWKAIVGDINFLEEPQQKEKEKQSRPWSGPLLRLISYTVVIGVILILIYYVLQYISFDEKIRRSTVEVDDEQSPVEDIAILDTRRLLEQAKRDKNYKLAVRLYYLELLKQLHARGAIAWKKDKTNREYLTELMSADFFFDEIRRLTNSYEAIWYGDHILGQNSFDTLSGRFETIYLKIGEGGKV